MGKKFYAMMAVLAFAAGGMDVNAVYTLDGIEVSADRQKDRFGNMITEQSYYRITVPAGMCRLLIRTR